MHEYLKYQLLNKHHDDYKYIIRVKQIKKIFKKIKYYTFS